MVESKLERVYRFVEEAVELAQACDVSKEKMQEFLDYVYSREPGYFRNEVGGVVICLALLCAAYGEQMDTAGEIELTNVWKKKNKIVVKHSTKPLNIRDPDIDVTVPSYIIPDDFGKGAGSPP